MRTRNQIEVGLPRSRAAELYTCHEQLASWSPGFLSIEVLSDGTADTKPTFKSRYRAMGKEIEEVLTLVENRLPEAMCVVATLAGGLLRRESRICFEATGPDTTRLTVHNSFSGAHAPYLVESELQVYTQAFLECFKDFAERQPVSAIKPPR